MKKIYTILVVCTLLFPAFNASAQGGFSDIIKVSPGDATKLVQAYGDPLFKGIGVGMNSGWTNTAKPKKLLHFDLRLTATGAFTPNSDKTFDVTKIGLSNGVGPKDPSQTITPTIGGERDTDGPTMNIYDAAHNKIDEFTLPSGKLPVIPSPQVQLTVGLVHGTDITLRMIPKINFGSDVGSVSMIGFGLKHDIGQYLFGKADKFIPFDLSLMLAYSRLNLSANLNVSPENGAQQDPSDPNKNNDFSNQHTDAHFTSFLAEAIISKKLLFFTPFLAVGYNTANASLAAIGNYPVTTNVNGDYSVYTNPVNINEKTISGMRADVGFQLNFGFNIFASASIAKYKSVNAGIGFGF